MRDREPEPATASLPDLALGQGAQAEPSPDNHRVADLLERVAALLEAKRSNPFRVMSYRNAAQAVSELGRPVAALVDAGGTERLEEMSGIGSKLAGAIEEIVQTGRLGLLDSLESEVKPEAVIARVPGIGPRLASRIHERLGIGTLEELEMAAHEGLLAGLKGIGKKKVRGIQTALVGMLSRSAGRKSRQRRGESGAPDRPGVGLLLKLDTEYRLKAAGGKLRKIAPRRFNPDEEAWLPVMETVRNGWSFTVLYSNTSRAHRLGKTNDWVVIYYKQGGRRYQNTVVTADRGKLRGKRVVRGREEETREHYAQAGETRVIAE